MRSKEVPIIRSDDDRQLWRAAISLTREADWTRSEEPAFKWARCITWAHYPDRYLMTAFAQRRLLPNIRLVHLLSLSAERVDTGLHDVRHIFLHDGKMESTFEVQMKLPHEMAPDDIASVLADREFVLDNRFDKPNNVDRAMLALTLESAYLDGVSAYVSK